MCFRRLNSLIYFDIDSMDFVRDNKSCGRCLFRSCDEDDGKTMDMSHVCLFVCVYMFLLLLLHILSCTMFSESINDYFQFDFSGTKGSGTRCHDFNGYSKHNFGVMLRLRAPVVAYSATLCAQF